MRLPWAALAMSGVAQTWSSLRPADELIGIPARFGYNLEHLRPQIEALAEKG